MAVRVRLARREGTDRRAGTPSSDKDNSSLDDLLASARMRFGLQQPLLN